MPDSPAFEKLVHSFLGGQRKARDGFNHRSSSFFKDGQFKLGLARLELSEVVRRRYYFDLGDCEFERSCYHDQLSIFRSSFDMCFPVSQRPCFVLAAIEPVRRNSW